MRKLTVIQMIPTLVTGGVERGTVEVNRALVERGHRSIVISGGGPMVESIVSHGGEHIELPIGRKSLRTLFLVKAIRQLARDTQADILHARSRVPAWIAYLAWKKMEQMNRPRFVTSMHGLNSVSRFSRIMTRGERVIAVSQTVRKYILDNYPQTDPDRIEVVFRGVDPEEFPYDYQPTNEWLQQWRSEFPQLNGAFVITLAGRITRLKGHRDLLDTVAALQTRGVNAHGLIVGGEDPRRKKYAESLCEQVVERGLDSHVTFTGLRRDIRDVLAVSDAVLSLNTKPESFGRSVLESVRLGRATFGYDHGGVGEILREIYPQGLVPIGNIGVLADKLMAATAGDIQKPQPTNTFLLSDMLDQTITMYERLVDAKPEGAVDH